MVIRFPLSIFSIILGVLLCIYTIALCPYKTTQAAIEYDPPDILIIDPGHGGADGGAVGTDGTIESGINLKIGLRLESLCHLYGVQTVMTRRLESIDYPPEADTIAKMKVSDQKARLGLIRDYPHAILFSIHQNSYPSETPKGVQVLYGPSGHSGRLAELLQENLNAALDPDSRRLAVAAGEGIYLMKHCDCTAALIECGFISNPTECKLLQSEAYQAKIAAILLGSYLQFVHDGQK